jgi:hypothetical protein
LTRRVKAKLIGSIRLVPNIDTIGVPIFAALRGNEMFVPEMDGDLRIVQYLEFYNEHGFQLSYDLPAEFQNRVYEVGSSTPMPFWISNVCSVIVGDADKEEPTKMFGADARSNPVLLDLARILDDARSGRIKDRFDEWASENIANGFADVFFEEPVRSRYWITRYRVAVARARRMTKPPHPIDNKLRHVAGTWFQKYGRKTDIRNVAGMLGSSANEILSKRQMTDILFAFLMNSLAWKQTNNIEAYVEEKALHKAFPQGLYHYYLEHGWPRVPFSYEQDANFIERMLQELVDAYDNENFEQAAKMALLLFGRADLPEQLDSTARIYLKNVLDLFRHLRDEAKPLFRDREKAGEWTAYAEALLGYYDVMMDLDGIINGKERMKRVPYDKRFGVTLQYLRDLKKIKKGDW